jgi:DNA repair exonuclease SbcCD nuclease subunit
MKIVLTADWHLNYKETNPIFLKVALDYLDYLEFYCIENNIENIFFLGDMLEKSLKIRHDHFVPLYLKLNRLKKRGLKVYMILGNHDIYSTENDSIVETFEPIVTKVIKDSEVLNLGGRSFTFLSYTKDEKKVPLSGDILLTHLAIADFEFDNAYHANETISIKRDFFKNFNQVFSGHFHKRQHIDNIWYVGSPYQLNVGEKGQQKGFGVLDTTNLDYQFIPYKNAPEFMIIKIEDFNKVDVKNKFVYVEIESKIDSFIKLKYILYERGALGVTPIFKPPKEDAEIGEVKIDKHLSSIPEISMEYLKNVKIDGIKNEKLIEMFKRVVEKVV